MTHDDLRSLSDAMLPDGYICTILPDEGLIGVWITRKDGTGRGSYIGANTSEAVTRQVITNVVAALGGKVKKEEA